MARGLWLLIDGNRRGHDSHRAVNVLGRGEHRGVQQAHPDQKRNGQGLRSTAENEFRPRRSRFRQQREERRLGGRRTHIALLVTSWKPGTEVEVSQTFSDLALWTLGAPRSIRLIVYYPEGKGCTRKAISLATGNFILLSLQLLRLVIPAAGKAFARKSNKLHPQRIF